MANSLVWFRRSPPGCRRIRNRGSLRCGCSWRQLVDMLRLAVAGVAAARGRTDLIFKVHLPAQEGDDWNQALQMAYTAKLSDPTSLSHRIR
jgi:hypothetical protein